MNFLIQELESLLTTPQSRIRSLVLAGIGAAITAIVTWLHLSRFATPDEIFTWSTALTGLLCTGAVHVLDHYVGNATVTTQIKQAQGVDVTATQAPAISVPDDHSLVPNSILTALLNGAQQSQQPTPPAPALQAPVAATPSLTPLPVSSVKP